MKAARTYGEDGRDAAAVDASSGFPPGLFLIGAQKCATTFFADVLAKHPMVEIASPKEPDYFTVNRSRGPDWYKDRFATLESRVLLDASPSYSAAPSRAGERREDNPRYGVPGRLAAFSPEARFVYLVRDPVARTYSAYWHHVRSGDEARPFLQAIEENSWYLDLSRYYLQIAAYLEIFPEDRLLVLDARDIARDPVSSAQRVWAHVGLSSDIDIRLDAGRKNVSYQLSGPGRFLLSAPGGSAMAGLATRLLRKAVSPRAFEKIRGLLTRDIPPMTGEQRHAVREALADDMRQFSAYTGICFED